MANSVLGIYPGPLGLTRPRSFEVSLVGISWAARPAN
jgi:hypothetical protein